MARGEGVWEVRRKGEELKKYELVAKRWSHGWGAQHRKGRQQ